MISYYWRARASRIIGRRGQDYTYAETGYAKLRSASDENKKKGGGRGSEVIDKLFNSDGSATAPPPSKKSGFTSEIIRPVAFVDRGPCGTA